MNGIFWTFFGGVLLVPIFFMFCHRKLFRKLEMTIKIQGVIGAIMFTLFSFMLMTAYVLFSIATANILFSPVLCALALLFSWLTVEKLYEFSVGEENNEEGKKKILSKEDKNVCNLCAFVGMVISGIVFYYEYKQVEYMVWIGIVISVWIGVYIPITDIYKEVPMKKIVHNVFGEFQGRKSVWISAIAVCIFVIIFTTNCKSIVVINEIAVKAARGLIAGSILLLIILWIISRKKENDSMY